jgi:moderate conductance mechanosensitive channel
VGLGAAFAGRALAMPVFRRLGHAAAASGLARKSLISVLAIAIDLAIVVGATLVAALTLRSAGTGASDGDQAHRVLFFAAFLVSGSLLVAVRAVFSPATRLLRPLPMNDAAARYWTWHLTVVVVLITFGEILVRPVVQELANPLTAHAATMALQFAALIYLGILVVRNRRAPSVHFTALAEKNPDDVSLPVIAALLRFWHLPVLVSLVIVMHEIATSSESSLTLLLRVAFVAAISAVAVLIIGLLNRVADRGLRMPPPLRRAIPTLEERLNGFVPGFLRFLRYIVLLVWVMVVLQVRGVLHPLDWIEARFGIDMLGAVVTLIGIVLVGFLAWLAIASWVDFKLAPHAGHLPTAREQTLFSLLRNAALIAILLLCLSYGLSTIGISVAPLLASAGVVGLAIGFGAQRLVQDIITGIFIQFENAINVGDVVEVAGKIGAVEKLTIRSVSLRDVEGVFHVIPFSSVDSVSNHMKGFSYHVADVSIAYRADIDAAKEAILAAYDDLVADMEWGTKLLGGIEWFGVQALAESAVVLRVRLKTRPGEQWGVGRAYTELVKKHLDAAGIEIPFRQMRLWFPEEGAIPAPQTTQVTPVRQSRREDAPTDADDDGGDGVGDTPR